MISPKQRYNQLRADVTERLRAISVAAVTLQTRLDALNRTLGRPRPVARLKPSRAKPRRR